MLADLIDDPTQAIPELTAVDGVRELHADVLRYAELHGGDVEKLLDLAAVVRIAGSAAMRAEAPSVWGPVNEVVRHVIAGIREYEERGRVPSCLVRAYHFGRPWASNALMVADGANPLADVHATQTEESQTL